MWYLTVLKWLIANWRETLLGILITYLVSANAVSKLELHNCEANYASSQAQVGALAKTLKDQSAGIMLQHKAQTQVVTQVAAAVTANKAAVASIAQANQKTLSTKVGDSCQSAMDLLKSSASSF